MKEYLVTWRDTTGSTPRGKDYFNQVDSFDKEFVDTVVKAKLGFGYEVKVYSRTNSEWEEV